MSNGRNLQTTRTLDWNRKIIRDALTDARAGVIHIENQSYNSAAVLLRMALDQLEEAGVLQNV